MVKDNSYYKLKYLKYKSKYINYKNLIGGRGLLQDVQQEQVTISSQLPPTKPLPLTPLQKQEQEVERIFKAMYPEIEYNPTILKKVPIQLLQGTQQYNEKVIRLFIFLNMEFVLLSESEQNQILDHIKSNTLFQKGEGEGEVMVAEVKKMLDSKFKDIYIPKLVRELLDNNGKLYLGTYENILKKICNGLFKLQFDSTFKCDFMNEWIHVNYVKDNDALFRMLVDTITDDENYEISTKILRSFISIIRSNRSISIKSKHEIIDKIDTLLVKLHNQYAEKTICSSQLRNLFAKYPHECYKLKNAHTLFKEVRKNLDTLKKDLDELEEKKRLSNEKYKKLQEDTKLEIEKLNELMQKISTKLEDVEKLKTKCLGKIDDTTKSQLVSFKKKFDESKNPDVLGNYYGVFKGIDADTIENECRNITPNIQFLSQSLRILERNVNELRKKYNQYDIPIIQQPGTTIVS